MNIIYDKKILRKYLYHSLKIFKTINVTVTPRNGIRNNMRIFPFTVWTFITSQFKMLLYILKFLSVSVIDNNIYIIVDVHV